MKIRKLFSTRYLREQFDFMLAAKWLVYGSIIGVVSGLAAALFQLLLSFVRQLSFGKLMGLTPLAPGGETELFHLSTGSFTPYLVVIIPTLGGLLAGWIVYTFAPEAEGHGTDEVIKAYHKKRGIINTNVPFVKLIASAITIGSGGSGGREGPIAQIGAGFGSFLGRKLGLNTRTRRWLLASGMGAGIGSIFHNTNWRWHGPSWHFDVIVPHGPFVGTVLHYSWNWMLVDVPFMNQKIKHEHRIRLTLPEDLSFPHNVAFKGLGKLNKFR